MLAEHYTFIEWTFCPWFLFWYLLLLPCHLSAFLHSLLQKGIFCFFYFDNKNETHDVFVCFFFTFGFKWTYRPKHQSNVGVCNIEEKSECPIALKVQLWKTSGQTEWNVRHSISFAWQRCATLISTKRLACSVHVLGDQQILVWNKRTKIGNHL